MTFFALLPPTLVGFVLFDVLAQQATAHFVDTHALARRVLLVVLAWASLGWLLEANAAATLAEISTGRITEAERGLEALHETLMGYITQ